MRARGVTTPRFTATASSSIDLKTVSSPGESSIRYMPDPMNAEVVEQDSGVRLQNRRNFHAGRTCIFIHDALTASSRCNVCLCLAGSFSSHALAPGRRVWSHCSNLQRAATAEIGFFRRDNGVRLAPGRLRQMLLSAGLGGRGDRM